MRKNEKGFTLLEVLIIIAILGIISAFLFKYDYYEKQIVRSNSLRDYFGISVPKGQREFTLVEKAYLRPAVEKRLKALSEDFQNMCNVEDEILKTKNELIIASNQEANESLQALIKAERDKKDACYNLRKACEVAKYFKLVPEDCEPCKAVK